MSLFSRIKEAVSKVRNMKKSCRSLPGGTETTRLCDGVVDDGTQVWFVEEQDGSIVWESQAEILFSDVYKQFVIAFKTPPYYNENTEHDVDVFLEIRKQSEKKRGVPQPFRFLKKDSLPTKCNFERKDNSGHFHEGFLKSVFVPRKLSNSTGHDFLKESSTETDSRIFRLSHKSGPVTGGTEIILLCDQVDKDDAQLWCIAESEGSLVWESQAEILSNDLYEQFAITFKTPPYYDETTEHDVEVFVELRKPSEKLRGGPAPFRLLKKRDPHPEGFEDPSVENYRYLQEEFVKSVFVPRKLNNSTGHDLIDEFDEETLSDMRIFTMSNTSGPVTGGTEVILLCSEVDKDDIQLWFVEEQEGNIVWEHQAEILFSDVYEQFGITLKTPPYYNENTEDDVHVFLELRKSSKKEKGGLQPFCYLKTGDSPPENFEVPVVENYRYLQEEFVMSAFIPRKLNKSASHDLLNESVTDTLSNFRISKLSHQFSPVTGGTEIILLCDQVDNNDIEVWFFEEQGGRIVWESQAEMLFSHVHKNSGITFKFPPYYKEYFEHDANVSVELRK